MDPPRMAYAGTHVRCRPIRRPEWTARRLLRRWISSVSRPRAVAHACSVGPCKRSNGRTPQGRTPMLRPSPVLGRGSLSSRTQWGITWGTVIPKRPGSSSAHEIPFGKLRAGLGRPFDRLRARSRNDNPPVAHACSVGSRRRSIDPTPEGRATHWTDTHRDIANRGRATPVGFLRRSDRAGRRRPGG